MSEAELVKRLREVAEDEARYEQNGQRCPVQMDPIDLNNLCHEAADALTDALAREGEMRRAAEVVVREFAQKHPYIVALRAALASPASSGEEKSHGSSAAERNIPRNVQAGKDTERERDD